MPQTPPTISPPSRFFGGQINSPHVSPAVINQPYSQFASQSATIPPIPAVPPYGSITDVAQNPANVLAPTYSNLKTSKVNPFTSGIGTGTATSVVFGANPTLYTPTANMASQTNETMPANSPVSAVISPFAGSPRGGVPALPPASPASGATGVGGSLVWNSPGVMTGNAAPSVTPSSATLDPTTTVAAAGIGGAALLLFML